MVRTALVTGASGLLGRQVQHQFLLAGWHSIGTGLKRVNPPDVVKLDVLDHDDIEKVLDDVKPNVVVHCAANRFPDSCTTNPEAARKLNVDASRTLAEATIARDILLIYISTDYVFSGHPGEAPYTTSSKPKPPNVYGQTKLEGEIAVLDVAAKSKVNNKVVVLRVPVLYGTCDNPKESAVNVLFTQVLASQRLKEEDPKIEVDNYALRYPTNTQDVGRVCRDISTLYIEASDIDLPNVLQFSSEDCMTKWEICLAFAKFAGLHTKNLVPVKPDPKSTDGTVRPYDSHLDTSGLRELGIGVNTVNFGDWWEAEMKSQFHEEINACVAIC